MNGEYFDAQVRQPRAEQQAAPETEQSKTHKIRIISLRKNAEMTSSACGKRENKKGSAPSLKKPMIKKPHPISLKTKKTKRPRR